MKKNSVIKFYKYIIFFIPIIVFLIALKLNIDIYINIHFVLTLIAVELIIVKFFEFRNNFDNFTESHAPEVLTTIGIAGCFIGLIIGFFPIAKMSLLENENADIFSKIPAIISSVTLSFISSAIGIIFSLLIKFQHKKISDRKKLNSEKNKLEILIEEIQLLNKNILYSSNYSLIEEFKSFRKEKNEQSADLKKMIEIKIDQLIENFKIFSNHLVENNINAIVKALNEVVKDFNSKITGQFGENFKELNYAVKDLVVWQNQYKDELAIMRLSQQQAVEDLSNAAKSLTDIVSNTKILSQISNEFQAMIVQLKANFDGTSESQKNFYEILTSMKNVIPGFTKNTNDLIFDLDLNVKQLFANIESHEKNLVLNLQKNQTEMKDILIESIKANNQEISSLIKIVSEDMSDKVKILDAALEAELNKSLESLGRVLGALSEKFTTDYSDITDKFKNFLNAIQEFKPEIMNRVN
ncbi:hypothetical protein [Silvanigrella aquatica]|uniref:MotA/TolQ/ExbB proton channel domain-containing protein n=1 Tax=Silvanigrella aquatica TaxID=1915309 RepID=A0A1L4CXV3_9BACT|nr:hypothetical protein [Silvanigrella aquatica]APJ02777.1 hypothetical protein AXG55_02090 [Silvanigrella aquatica]